MARPFLAIEEQVRSLQASVSTFTCHTPVLVGAGAAVLLFFLFSLGTLKPLSANTDHPWMGYDFFGFPRCGLALRFGTSPFRAAEDYSYYGPWATPWVSHPTACLIAVPLSYLSPWRAFWSFNLFHLLLHVGIITVFGLRLSQEEFARQRLRQKARDLVFFAAMGFFLPWFVMYYMGQYHSFAVLAVALVLATRGRPVPGFVVSAVTKPVLAPVALVLVIRRQWKVIATIMAFVALGYLPWMLFRYDLATGLRFEANDSFLFFLRTSESFTKYSVYRWNQQISLSAALDEWLPATQHLPIRYGLAAVAVGAGVLLFHRKRFEVAVSACLLWFFFLYARGHEYHATLYVPLLLSLYVLDGGRYRGWPLVGIALLLALPTSYPLFKALYGFPNPQVLSNDVMLQTNALLYYAFLWQKPLCAFLLLGLMLVKEWPYHRPDPSETAGASTPQAEATPSIAS